KTSLPTPARRYALPNIACLILANSINHAAGRGDRFYCPGGYLARHPRRASDAAQSLSRRPVSAEEDRDVGVRVSRRSKGGREPSAEQRIRPVRCVIRR